MISGSYFPNHDTVIRTLQNYKEMLERQIRKGHLLLAWKKLIPKWMDPLGTREIIVLKLYSVVYTDTLPVISQVLIIIRRSIITKIIS